MQKEKKLLLQYIDELNALQADPSFKEKVFNLDGSPSSPYLKLYSEVIQKYFDTKNTEEIKDFNTIKEQAQVRIKEKNISAKQNEENEQKFLDMFAEDKYKVLLDTLINFLTSTDKKEDLETVIHEFEEKFKDHEDKDLLTEILITEQDINLKEYIVKLLKVYDLIIDYEDDEKIITLQYFKHINNMINKSYYFKDYLEIMSNLKELFAEMELSSEESNLIIDLINYQNKLTKTDKEVMELELEYILLAEYIYINKFDKLIKKIIHKNTQNRYISSSVAGTISSSNTEKNLSSKHNKDDLLNLVKKEALSYAMEGFLIGMRRYDISMGNQLSTYMTWWLEQRVIYYIEKDSSLNKATKIIDNLKNYSFEDAEDEDFRFHKFDNIKYSNFNFQDIDDMSNSIIETEEVFFNYTQQDLVYDILVFFCKYKDIFMYHEYLLIKYDLLLENFIHFIDINPKQEIIDCFYEDINIFIKKLQKQEEYKDLKEFTKVTEFYKVAELLETYFNVEHSDFLSIKRSLKQKFINMLNKVFTNTEES